MLALPLISSGCSGTETHDCGSSELVVKTTRDPSGTVTTDGACTPVHCTAPLGPPSTGCTEWRGEMTSTNPKDSCAIVFVGQLFYDQTTGEFTHTKRVVIGSSGAGCGVPGGAITGL
jgi:hypothetical protein